MKIVAVLYPNPKDGYPQTYLRDSIPVIDHYPDGQKAPTPKGVPFQPGQLLGSVTGGLGLRSWLEELGHEYVVTSDKEGPSSEFDKHLKDADIIVSQPFWPAYMDAQRFKQAERVKLIITAGIGSDHTDLAVANERGVTVAEVTFSNSISVAEHIVMTALAMVRNFSYSHNIARTGGWDIADCVARSYDIEGMDFGTIGSGRIGLATLRRMKPFDVKLHYHDARRLPEAVEKELRLIYHDTVESIASSVDILNFSCPLHPQTKGLLNSRLISIMRKGTYVVNTARGLVADEAAVVHGLESGRLAGYGGDVWFPQPAPAGHPWRTMPRNAMVPHISGSSLSAQARYCAGVKEILEAYFEDSPIRSEYLITHRGKLAGTGAKSYTV
jgi:formate dehydrogenase